MIRALAVATTQLSSADVNAKAKHGRIVGLSSLCLMQSNHLRN
jgi:hypothetical protein